MQEIHLVALHLVCEEFDAALGVTLQALRAVAGGSRMSMTIVVVGDSLLDVDVVGTAERLVAGRPGAGARTRSPSRSGPAGRRSAAAFVARADEDADVVLVTPLTEDEDGRELLDRIDRRLRVVPLPCDGATSVKTRLRCGSHTVARLDRGGTSSGNIAVSAEAAAVLARADAVLVSDYGRGVTTDASLRRLLDGRGRAGAARVGSASAWRSAGCRQLRW